MIKQFLAKIVLVALTFLGINVQPITQVQEVTKAPIVRTQAVQAPVKFGVAIPNTPALVDTYLASSITNTATSLTLASGSTNDGTALAGFMCFTLDANTPQVEYVCGTASSTSVTSVTRGVDFTNPNATTTKSYTHRRFSTVQATDYPTIQFIQRKLNGTDTFDGIMSYTTASTTGAFTNAKQIVSKGYVDGIVIAGGVVANETTPGISQLATQAQTSSGTATSGAYSLIPQNKYFNATSSATTTVPVTKANGKLSQGFLDLTEGFTFSQIPLIPTTTPTLSTQVISKNYFDTKVQTLATTSEAVSFSTPGGVGGSSASSTGMTITTDGTQALVINYVANGFMTDGQTHGISSEIFIGGVSYGGGISNASYTANIANGNHNVGATVITGILPAGAKTIYLKVSVSGTSSSYSHTITGKGIAYTIK